MMTRLEQLVLLVLNRAQKEGKDDLSKFQIFKLVYLLQVYALKLAGAPIVPELDLVFVREKNGPISINIYNSLDSLVTRGYVEKKEVPNIGYGYSRHAFSLKKKIPKLAFNQGEVLFIDSMLSELLPMSQKKLKQLAYSTESMVEVTQKEKTENKDLVGTRLNLNSISLDADVVDAYADESN